jgi:hypothetical protein
MQLEMLKHNISEQEKKNPLVAWICICVVSLEEPVCVFEIEVIFLQEASCKSLFWKGRMLELLILLF